MRPSLLGLDEGVVVALVLVGVGLGELDEGPVEGVTGAQVGGDGDTVAGAGVGPDQRAGTHAGVEGHGGGVHGLDQRGALPVPELTDVEVALDAVDTLGVVPAQEDVAAGLHEVLAVHHPFAMGPAVAAPDELLEHRGLGLLGLEEQRIGVVAAEHQHDPRPSPDTADTDHLAGHVGQAEVLEQVAAVARQRPAVAADHCPHEVDGSGLAPSPRTAPRSAGREAGR